MLFSSCVSPCPLMLASSPKRGKTKCQSWKRKREVDSTKVEIEIPIELKRVVGKNSTQFVSEASYLMKQYMPLDMEKWDDIHPDKKRKYFMKLKVLTYYSLFVMSIFFTN